MKPSTLDRSIEKLWKLQKALQERPQAMWDCTSKLVQDAHDKKATISESRIDELLRQIDKARVDVLRIGQKLETLNGLH